MKTMKSLMLAGFAVVSLGVGLANAQGLTPSAAEGAYYSGKGQTPAMNLNRGASVQNSTVQYGSSDQPAAVPFDTNATEGGF